MRLEGDECDVQTELVENGAAGGGRKVGFVNVEGHVEGAAVRDCVNEASFFQKDAVFVRGVVGCDREAFKDGM